MCLVANLSDVINCIMSCPTTHITRSLAFNVALYNIWYTKTVSSLNVLPETFNLSEHQVEHKYLTSNYYIG